MHWNSPDSASTCRVHARWSAANSWMNRIGGPEPAASAYRRTPSDVVTSVTSLMGASPLKGVQFEPHGAAPEGWRGSDGVELTVAALGDRDGLQPSGRRAGFDRTGGGVELRAVARAHDLSGGLVVSDRAAGMRAHRVEGHELPGGGLDHDSGVAGAGIGERRGAADRDILGGSKRRSGRMPATGPTGPTGSLAGRGRRLGRGRQG